MNTHDPLNPMQVPAVLAALTPDEAAALYFAGALSDQEIVAMHQVLSARHPAYLAALRKLDPAAEELFKLSGEASPPAALKAAILARIEGQQAAREASSLDADGLAAIPQDESRELELVGAGSRLTILRAATQKWRPLGVRGVRYRTLVADRRANRRTILLQMDPGTSLPDHGHAGLEEVYVISGDLSIGAEALGPGDYFRVPQGADHGTPRSSGGCTAIIISGYYPYTVASIPRMIWQAVLGWFGRH